MKKVFSFEEEEMFTKSLVYLQRLEKLQHPNIMKVYQVVSDLALMEL